MNKKSKVLFFFKKKNKMSNKLRLLNINANFSDLPVSHPSVIPAGADQFPSLSNSFTGSQRVGVEEVTKRIETKGYSQVGPACRTSNNAKKLYYFVFKV